MANFEAYAKQDSRVGKWGYFYSYTDEQTLIGKAGQSGYIFDSKEDAEKAIEDLQVELSEWAKKEFEKKIDRKPHPRGSIACSDHFCN